MSTQERDHALTRNCCGGGESMIHFIHYPRVELRRGGYVHAVYLRDFTIAQYPIGTHPPMMQAKVS